MIARLPAEKVPPPRPVAISRFERLFHVAAGLDTHKADVKRVEEFVNRKIYDLLLRGQANAKANGRVVIELQDLPITKGLQESIQAFREMDETIALQPILNDLARRPRLDFTCSDETEAQLPDLAGGLNVALARAFKLIDPEVKNPQSKHWERACGVFDLLL